MTRVTPDRLLAGLDAIAASLSKRPQALALLALGSCGLETVRLDAFSDLDFFVLVEQTAKAEFLEDLDWLAYGAPLVFTHRNTQDGYKTLDGDGVFCEFAVFYPAELTTIPFAPGRVVWARDDFDVNTLVPTKPIERVDIAWTSTEALTNILVGLKRYLRGELHSARRAILVDAAEGACRAIMTEKQADPYNPWRRMEQVQPAIAAELEDALTQASLTEAARKLLVILSQHHPLPAALTDEIARHLDLCNAR